MTPIHWTAIVGASQVLFLAATRAVELMHEIMSAIAEPPLKKPARKPRRKHPRQK